MGFFDYSLDKNTPIPLYYQIKQTILSEIKNGNAIVGSILPTEEQYCSYYNVSRTTVRQAITELVNEGWLYRTKGKGTFVSASSNIVSTNLSNMYNSYMESAGRTNRKATMFVVSIDIMIPPEHIKKELNLQDNEKVIKVYRYLKADDTITGCVESYLPYPLCDQTLDAKRFESNSMYLILSERPETEIKKVERHIHAEVAAAALAKELKIKKGDPVLYITNHGYSKENNKCIIYEEIHYIGSKNVLIVEYEMGTTNLF